ncbi:MAG: polysaccharide deacetylase family protein [Planctomycetes bacterium]|nr:polysaccharide deacetylase family protein [Planctomycetota bacterium]
MTACSARWFARRGRPRRVVLCYHSIHPTNRFASASPQAFTEQLTWLRQACDVVPFSRITAARADDAKPAVAITFDDGYADNHDVALPILHDLGLGATFFVTAGFVDRDPAVLEHFQRDRGASLEEIAPLTWEQVAGLRSAGMDIGAHTWSHANLAQLPAPEVERELRRSKELLEERLGAEVATMAYPYGKRDRHFTDETMRIAASVGYESCAAVLFRGVTDSDDRHAIPRFFINGGDDLRSLQAKVRGDWDVIGWWQESSPRWAARLVSPSDFAQEAVRA